MATGAVTVLEPSERRVTSTSPVAAFTERRYFWPSVPVKSSEEAWGTTVEQP